MARGAGCRGEASAAVGGSKGNESAYEIASWRRARHAGLETGPGMLHHGCARPFRAARDRLSHPSGRVVSVQPERKRHREDVTEMKRQEPLRISCDGCPGGCDDCLVEFFMAEREALVVRLGGGDEAERPTAAPTTTPRPLDADLERVLEALTAAGLQPTVLSVYPNEHGVSQAS
jgi:hypothetical protein